ncbi:MAG: lipoyl(octanoyl) transferase LipB [Ferrovum sp.]|nr:lipoyl(octanoyl) transferase LipB [Ferrovum sp.]NDU87874.1 lipoyl(octanoyl) transferase LipB [Ferrovum sp.]
MRTFTDQRQSETQDELWAVQHEPVYTLGQAGRQEYLRETGSVPVIRCDRGGQVTYHGPGQAVIYCLVDLRRRPWGIKSMVERLETAVIGLLAQHGVRAERRTGAPGVYVAGSKIAALGLRVRQGCSYHGLALNVDLDLAPFAHIDPCGFAGLTVTRTRDLGCEEGVDIMSARLMCLVRESLDQERPT